jgi:spermidine synthase/tetratricopeptide (TPR) repeat protein
MVALYLAAALSGWAALILEMTWSRQLALVLGGSSYSYTATLFVVLLGIATGSLVFHLWLRRWASSPWMPIGVVGLLLFGTLAGIRLLPWVSIQVAPVEVRLARGELLGNGLICVGASCLVELLPAVGMGILFPLFVHLTRATAARVGTAVGNIYACNTAGSILGATFTAVLLFPRLGTAGAAALAAAMYVVTLLAMLPWEGWASRIRRAASAAVGAAAVALVAIPTDPHRTNMGFGIYGNDPLWEVAEVLFFEEGASSNVLVAKLPPDMISLRVNGKVDASNGGDMATQIGLAYIPRIFKPDAKEVLVIGFGSGCTPGHSLQFPDTRVTCCELEPAVYSAAHHFDLVNRRPHEQTRAWLEARNAELPSAERLSEEEIDRQARFAIVFGDGRTTIQASDKKYDLIISEPSNPWVAGCSNLFTREFFHAARERLSEDGVLAQWIQTYNFTLEDYLLIVRTMRSEFPYYGVMTLSGGSDTLLLASSKPLLPEPDKLAAMQSVVDRTPLVKADLEAWFGQADLRWLLLRHYLAGKDQLDRVLAGVPSTTINTDVNLRLEFDAPLQLFKSPDPKRQAMTVLPKALEKDKSAWASSLAQRMGIAGGTPEFFVALGDQTLTQAAKYEIATLQRGPVYASHVQNALPWYAIALELQPDNAAARRGQQRAQLMLDEKSDRPEILQKLVALDPSDAEARAQLASWHLGKKEHARAVAEYEEALRFRPELSFSTRNYTWANNLAWLLATSPDDKVRNGPAAIRWAQAAYDVSGHADWETLDTLSVALAENGQFAEAIAATERLIAHFADKPQRVADFEKRLARYRESKPFHESP